MREMNVKEDVRKFYDSVGWRQVDEGVYQNARYEDLRPVSQPYLHHCHMRVKRALPDGGRYLLDAGSGPVQYPEYLTYSEGFERRVCLDISIRALREARQRLQAHGWFVVGDVANLPFAPESFDGVVSMHTIHHLPPGQQERAFRNLFDMLAPGATAVTVYSWGGSALLTRLTQPAISFAFTLIRLYRRVSGRDRARTAPANLRTGSRRATGTYTHKHNYRWMRDRLSDLPGFEIRTWRSVSTQFLRAFIHRPLLGRLWLRLLIVLESAAPRLFGRIGQYPLIVFSRPLVDRPNAKAVQA